MDLSIFNEIAPEANSILAPFCMILLVGALVTDKHLNSASLALLVLCLGEGIESIAAPHLIKLSKITELYGYFGWYVSWIMLHTICMALLLKLHHVFKLHLSNVALLIAWYYMAALTIQAIDFIERLIFDSGVFEVVYQVSNLALNVLIVPVAAFVFVQEYRWHKRQQALMQEA